ncbi:MAG TPA: diguanylate cyclase, partial [Pyrinomonadaceae bacterium]|nr:diguanylate cyclase [Pyrinomonadaceae bacterium]
GIIEDHLGVAREAAGGTLFLNEIGDLSISNQAELLRLIEYGEIYSADCSMLERLDVRIIAATNRDLRQEVEHGFFRADLFYRLDTFHIEIPPLRERAEDIPALAKHFIEDAHKRHNKQVSFTPASLEAMRQLPLKGNARELQNLIERTFLTATDGLEISDRAIETVALRQTQKGGFVDAWAGCSLEEEVRRYEGRLIQLALDAVQGRITHTARLLGITHQSLSFILNGRHKGLLSARKPARRRRSSVIRPTLKKALEHEKKLARTDFLTGVANERYFYELVGAEIKRAGRYKHPFTVAYLDIDNFKNVNDRFGHGEGDSLLRLVADSVKSSIRSADVVARLGGDEFAVLLPETGFEPAQIVIGKVQKSLLEAVRRKGLSVTVSIGVVTCPSSSCTIDEIMKLADAQMYSVKHSVKGMIKHVVLGESGASAASSDE